MKKIFYAEEARDKILSGAKQLYDAVKVTYGPKGQNAGGVNSRNAGTQRRGAGRYDELVIGLGVFFYPPFANYWNSFTQTKAIETYAEEVGNLNEEEYARLMQEAEAYNEDLKRSGIKWRMSDEDKAKYTETLNVGGSDRWDTSRDRRSPRTEREYTAYFPDTADFQAQSFSQTSTRYPREIRS